MSETKSEIKDACTQKEGTRHLFEKVKVKIEPEEEISVSFEDWHGSKSSVTVLKMEEQEPEIRDTCTQKESTRHLFEKVKVKMEPEEGVPVSMEERHRHDKVISKMKLNELKESEKISNDTNTKIKIEREKVDAKEKEKKDSTKVCIKRKFDGHQKEGDGIVKSKIQLLDKSKSNSEQSKTDVSTMTPNTKISNIKIIENSILGANGNSAGLRSIINMANIKAGNVAMLNSDNGSSGGGTVKYTSLLANKPLGLNVKQNKISGDDKSGLLSEIGVAKKTANDISKSSSNTQGMDESNFRSSPGVTALNKTVIVAGKSPNKPVSILGMVGSDLRSPPGVTELNKTVIAAGKSPNNPVSILGVGGSNSGSLLSIPAVSKVVTDTSRSANNAQSSEGSNPKIKYQSILNLINSKPSTSVPSKNVSESVSGSSSGNAAANQIIINAGKSPNNPELSQSADGSNKKITYRSILNPVNNKPSPVSNTNFSSMTSKVPHMQNANVGATVVDSKSDEADLEFYNPTNFNVLVNRVGGELRIKMVDSMPLDHSKTGSGSNKDTNDKKLDCYIDEFGEDYQIGDADHPSETHACNFCARLFPTAAKLAEHAVQHSVKDFYQCYVCKAKFLFDDDLREHFSIHTVDKPYKCDICEKQFTSNSGLNMHKLIHTGDKPHPCPICGKEFTRATVLRRHQRVHTGEKLFRCEECGKHYANSFSLGQHKLIHTGERPHKCEECGKEFRLSNGLRRHMLLHTGEKPHCCYYCGRNFRQSTQLKNHKCSSLKNSVQFFECPDCGEKFVESSELYVHMATHSG